MVKDRVNVCPIIPSNRTESRSLHKNIYTNAHSSFILFIYVCMYVCMFWLHWVFAARGLSLVVASGGYYLFAVCGLLIAVASLVTAHGL